MAFRDHLSDATTYRHISPMERQMKISQIRASIKNWIQQFQTILEPHEKKFLTKSLATNETPLPVFYLTMKVHKTPLKSRPIISCSGSLLQPLGIWIDHILQRIAQRQRSYFKSSFELKTELVSLELPAGVSLFTADAVSMYTNIPTDSALQVIGDYLNNNQADFPDVPIAALMHALRLVMKNNVFTFGDTTWLQLCGTAMGTPPAPPYATLYYAIHENLFLDQLAENLVFYRRFIDDVFGIWRHSNDPILDSNRWTYLQARMNAFHGLEWEFSDRRQSADFMDLTISIAGSRLTTTLYEKCQNLYLYISPHSAHPPGLITGVVMGGIHRIYTLCSDPNDAHCRTKLLYLRLLACGWKPESLCPLFAKAIKKAQSNDRPTLDQPKNDDPRIFFHVQYHPQDPPSSTLQRCWKQFLARPPYSKPLLAYRNHTNALVGLDRMIVAYKRPPNLGNLLSYRKLRPSAKGPPVSSYLPGTRN